MDAPYVYSMLGATAAAVLPTIPDELQELNIEVLFFTG